MTGALKAGGAHPSLLFHLHALSFQPMASSMAIMTPNSMREASSTSEQGQSRLTQWHYSKSPSLKADRAGCNARRARQADSTGR